MFVDLSGRRTGEGSLPKMNTERLLSKTGPMQLKHLVLYLLRCVRQEYGGVGIAGAHFRLRPLQGREEGRVQQCWLWITDPWSDITGHPEIGVL